MLRRILVALRLLPLVRRLKGMIWGDSYTTSTGRMFKMNLMPGEVIWFIDRTTRKMKLSLTSADRKLQLTRLLAEANPKIAEPALVTITIPSRKVGNRDTRLGVLLDSFVKMTDHPERFEILIKIDSDDDLAFFYRIKKRYSNLNLRFFAGPRERGYANLTLFHSQLVDQASPASKVWLCTWDDYFFTRKGWDLDVYDLIDRVPFFIAGHTPFETVISLMPLPTKPEPVYAYQCETNPLISFNLIRALRTASEGLEGWSPLGDLYTVDGFFGAVVHLFQEVCGIKVYHEIGDYMASGPRLITWTTNPERVALYYHAHNRFFEQSQVDIRSRVVEQMFQELSLASQGEYPEAASLPAPSDPAKS